MRQARHRFTHRTIRRVTSDPPTANASIGPVQSPEDPLLEIVDVLERLRAEFGAAMAVEIQRLVNEAETGAGKILELRERNG